jgi:hypothetical protein
MVKTKEKEELDKLVEKCFLWSDIPFNIAKNPFYHSMFEIVAIVGPIYKGPTQNELRGPLLQGEKVNCCYTSKLLTSIVSQVSSLQVSQVPHFAHKYRKC